MFYSLLSPDHGPTSHIVESTVMPWLPSVASDFDDVSNDLSANFAKTKGNYGFGAELWQHGKVDGRSAKELTIEKLRVHPEKQQMADEVVSDEEGRNREICDFFKD